MRVDISILVMGDASDAIGCDRRTSKLSNAAPHMKQYTTSTEK